MRAVVRDALAECGNSRLVVDQSTSWVPDIYDAVHDWCGAADKYEQIMASAPYT
jgi:hypothetical protein